MTQTRPVTELAPSSALVQEATLKALEGRIDVPQIQKYVEELTLTEPAPIDATATVALAVYGNLKVFPENQPWKYDITIWGGPAYFATSIIGGMYTTFSTWDAFFQQVTFAHVQGAVIGGAAGFLQVNWFIDDGTPVGQFNSWAGGIGLMEAAGSGKWAHL